MITYKKLTTLKDRTRLRKISMILHDAAVCARNGQPLDMEYINEILPLAGFSAVSEENLSVLAFRLEDMSQNLLSRLGAEPSDWDFRTTEGELDPDARIVQDKILVLDSHLERSPSLMKS